MRPSDDYEVKIADREAPVRRGEDLYDMALELSRSGVRGGRAIEVLLEAAAGADVVRRAHRLAEYAVQNGWPAPHEVVKAFFYLAAARARIDRAHESAVAAGPVQPQPAPHPSVLVVDRAGAETG